MARRVHVLPTTPLTRLGVAWGEGPGSSPRWEKRDVPTLADMSSGISQDQHSQARTPRRTGPVRLLVVASAMVVVLAVAASPVGAALTVEHTDAVAGHVEQVRDDLDLPHVSVVVSDGEEPVLERTFGEGRGLGPDSQVLVGSVAKSMTATLVAQQLERGRLALDDDVESLLPWTDLPDVTVEQLLTHTSGFTAADGLAVSERGATGPSAVRGAVEDLERSGAAGPYRYSSANYLVLGAVLEEVTGRRFATVLRTDLLEPLGMADTTALRDEADLVEGHRWWFGRPFPVAGVLDESGGPYGYVASTYADLQIYAEAQAGARPDVLDEDLLDLLHEPRVAADDDSYGLGWRVKGDGADRVVHHTGASPGYFAHVVVRPSDGRTVVVVADAYGEAQALPLATLATDVLAITDGERVDAVDTDPLLSRAPWALAGLSLLGLGIAATALARPRRRSARLVGAAGTLLVVVLAWFSPQLLGSRLGVLRIWAPDIAWSLVAVLLAWALATLVLLVRRPG